MLGAGGKVGDLLEGLSADKVAVPLLGSGEDPEARDFSICNSYFCVKNSTRHS